MRSSNFTRAHLSRVQPLLLLLPRLSLWTLLLASHLSAASVAGFMLPPPSSVYQQHYEPHPSTSWPYNTADGAHRTLDASEQSNAAAEGHYDEWSVNQLVTSLSSVGVAPQSNQKQRMGGRIPRSCNTHNMKSLYSSACSKNFKRSSTLSGGGFTSNAPQTHVNDQGILDLTNAMAVATQLPLSPSSSFAPSAQADMHTKGGGGGRFLQALLQRDTEAANEEVPVIVDQNKPVATRPKAAEKVNWPSVRLLVESDGWSKSPHGGGAPTAGGLIVVVEQRIDPLDMSRSRRASAKKEEIQRIAKKCCSDGCDEKDFFPLCYM